MWSTYRASGLALLLGVLSSLTIYASCRTTITFETISNERPIIGILSQESFSFESIYPGVYKSYIAASYVKFVEGAGARAIPIWIGKEKSYYENIMSKINGVLFPGGGTWFNETDGYADAGEHIYNIAKTMNDEGDFFPLWGTCLGFELLTYLSANRNEHRISCQSSKQALPLEFKKDFKTSRIFKDASDEVISILSREHVTSNFHSYCVTEENMTKYDIDNEWKVVSVNHDWNGLEFISIIESKHYPFYGVQFHPEKNIYEWAENRNMSHTHNAVTSNSYFGEFFIGEARKSFHKFSDEKEEQLALIYNYPATYTGINGSLFVQSYLFRW